MTLTTKTMLRYPGGKSRAVKILAPLIPTDVKHVVSPFLGGGSVELALTERGIHVEASDLFSQLVTFWNVLQDTPDVLADRLAPLLGTIDKETFLKLQQALRENTAPALDIATWFYIVNRCSFSGTTLSGGYSRSTATDRFTASSVERVRTFYNPLLKVSHKDYRIALEASPNFFFLDPPYLLGGSRDSLYGNRGDMHEAFNHVEFRDRVKDRNVRTLITYNNIPEIYDLWQDAQWSIYATSWSYSMNASKQSSEVIIANYPIEL